jgi:hypothetical protein
MKARKVRRRAGWFFAAVIAAVAAPGCGQDSALVGGACATGYVQCGDRCLVSDEQNCGVCGRECDERSTCVAGTCTFGDGAILRGGDAGDASPDSAPPDATGGDAGEASDDAGGLDATIDDGSDAATTDDGTAADATIDDGSSIDGTPDGGTTGDAATTDDGTTDDASAIDAADDASAIDAADDASAIDAPDDADSGQCPSGQQSCGGTCTDLTSDPANCGACDVFCPSQICAQSLCVGSTSGGVVLIGHDYASTSYMEAKSRVLANAVFLGTPRGATGNEVDVLSYEAYSDPGTLTQIQKILSRLTPAGRTLNVVHTQTDADVANISLSTYSVLLVPDQRNGAGVDWSALGSSWAPAVTAFAQAGGIVVILDGGTGADQMPALVSAMGLLNVSGDAPLPAKTAVNVWAPGDAVGIGVTNPYAVGTDSVTFATEPSSANVVYVVGLSNDAGQSPVVVHKVF